VRLAGGGARSDAWCQLKADVLGVPVVRAAHRETGLIGAAVAGAAGLGWHPTLAAAVDAMGRVDRAFEPRAAHRPCHARRAVLYRRVKGDVLARADAGAAPPRKAAPARRRGVAARANP
jgi:xylulokinase